MSDFQDNEPLSNAEILQEIVMALVKHPEFVSVDELELSNKTLLKIKCRDRADAGLIIGKKGRTIEPILAIMNKIAERRKILPVQMEIVPSGIQ